MVSFKPNTFSSVNINNFASLGNQETACDTTIGNRNISGAIGHKAMEVFENPQIAENSLKSAQVSYDNKNINSKKRENEIFTLSNGDRYQGKCLHIKAQEDGIRIWNNGNRYKGEFSHGEGHGFFTLSNGGCYEGEFSNGNANDNGIYNWSNGNRYEGEFSNGKPHGKGILIRKNGDRYEGEFSDGKPHGKGIAIFNNGDRYEGEFLHGHRHGKGIFTWKNGDRYEGEFSDGKFHGKGIAIFNNGARYEGEFSQGKSHGKGILTHKDGYRYEGEFSDGKFHGKGIEIFNNGDRYEGEFSDGKPHGKGILTHKDGYRYEGEFSDGKFHGKGICNWSNGNRYEGEFSDGKIHGKGIKIFNNGDRYEGEFLNDYRHGEGILTQKDGYRYEGEFSDGKFHGIGIEILNNGDRYEGEFLHGYRHGKGIYTWKNGDRYEGEFLNGYQHGKGKFTSDGGVCELTFVRGHAMSDASNLGDSLFLQLLSQKIKSSGNTMYSLRIMADYLLKKGYVKTGKALKEAGEIHFLERDGVAREIHKKLQTCRTSQLLSFTTVDHAMGLKIKHDKEGFIDLEIYNSGKGLPKYHLRHPSKDYKFQTTKKSQVPLASLTIEKLLGFMEPFSNIDTAYDSISILQGRVDVLSDSIIWQNEQKGNNCTLMWIFAYLKANMQPKRYAKMRYELFTDAILAAEKASHPNPILIESLKKKQAKLALKKQQLESVTLKQLESVTLIGWLQNLAVKCKELILQCRRRPGLKSEQIGPILGHIVLTTAATPRIAS